MLIALKVISQGKPFLHERRFAFEDVNQAHALYESGKHIGKIVLTP